MKRREFVKSSICLGCAGACGLKMPFANAEEMTFTPEEELAMQKFVYKNSMDLPKKIRLDICNLCQLNCVACWMRIDEEKIKNEAGGFGYVTFEQFKKVIDENPYLEEIEVSNHGEIFLNPDFDKIIKYAYQKNVALTAETGVNLNTISEETAENLVKYQFRHLTISIDGATPEIYAIYRRGGNFNTVINNIKMINKFKEKYNSPYPEMIYKFIVFGHNEHEIKDAKNVAKNLGIPIKYDVNCAKGYSPIKNKKRALKLTGIKSFDTNEENLFLDYKYGSKDWYFCTYLFDCPQFDYNGDLFGCCTPYLETFGVNLFKDGLMNCLNNKKVLYAKLMLTNFEFNKHLETPCDNCYRFKKLKDENYPLRVTNCKGVFYETT